MKKRFNITGVCVPSKHYMVDISRQLEQIRDLVDDGAYFTINKARQYGKTTTLNALAKDLASEYLVVSMDFQALGNESFANEKVFSLTFAQNAVAKPGNSGKIEFRSRRFKEGPKRGKG